MDQELWIIECGHRRRAKISICEYCNKEFLKRISNSTKRKYCSKNCAVLAQENKIILCCYNCKKEIKKTPSKLKNSKHGYHFCSRACKEESQKLGGNCPEIRPPHYGTSGIGFYKEYIEKHPNITCVGCRESKRYLLVVHHIDGNRLNNIENNLEVVCYNCHAIRHLCFKNGEWTKSSSSLTPRDQLNLFYK